MSPGGSYWAVEYTLMECAGCRSPFVVKSSSPAEDDFGYVSDDCWTLPEQVLPQVDEAIDDAVPTTIAKSYLEAKRCLRGHNYTAAALMCRRTVELICKDQNADGNSLWAMLKDLKTKLILDERMYQWADQVLRRLGNEGAHDPEYEIEREDAIDAVEFSRAIIWSLFVLTAAFSRHVERRAPKPPPPSRQPGKTGTLKNRRFPASASASAPPEQPEQPQQPASEPQQSASHPSPPSGEV